MFDIDGVLARGKDHPLPEAVKMFQLITNPKTNNLLYPTVFLTNACGCDITKAQQLKEWFKIKVGEHQIYTPFKGKT